MHLPCPPLSGLSSPPPSSLPPGRWPTVGGRRRYPPGCYSACGIGATSLGFPHAAGEFVSPGIASLTGGIQPLLAAALGLHAGGAGQRPGVLRLVLGFRLVNAVDRGRITATSAAVVWRTRVQQEDDAEVAAELGVDVRTLQRRRQRAERALAKAS